MAELPRMTQIVAVWIGRDEEGRAAAVLVGSDDSKHHCVREDGVWKAIALDTADGGEYRVEGEPTLDTEPWQIAKGLHEDDVVPPINPSLN